MSLLNSQSLLPESMKHLRGSLRLLFLLGFVSAAYFSNSGSWNQNARLHPIFSYVEAGEDQFSFHFNRYMPRPDRNIVTGDWSRFEGNYYSNKAPGTTLLGILPYSLLYKLHKVQGLDLSNPYLNFADCYLINLFVSVLPFALSLPAFCIVLIRLGCAERYSVLLSALFGLASMMLPYSTQLWGHTTAASFLVFSLFHLGGESRRSLFFAAWYAGLAVCTDYLAFPSAIAVSIICFSREKAGSLFFVLGTIPAIVLLGCYHWICFGSPFALPTDYTNPQFIDPERTLGLFGSFSPQVLWNLSFGKMRGLFFMNPILLLALPGFYLWYQAARHRLVLLCAFFVCLGTLLLNASFNGWHAGATVGPRYQIVALPFWFMTLAFLGRYTRYVLYPLAALSVFQMIATAAVSPLAPDVGSPPAPHPSPMLDWVYARFFDGQLGQFVYPIRMQFFDPQLSAYIRDASWNVGMLLGLPGLWTLAPLIFAILYIAYCLLREQQHSS